MNKLSSLEEIYISSFNDELEKIAIPIGNIIPKNMKKTRDTVAGIVKGYRKGFKKIDVDIIPSDYPKSKIGKKALKALEYPGKMVKKISKKTYFNPEVAPISMAGLIVPAPGGMEAAAFGYLAAKKKAKQYFKKKLAK